MPIRYIPTLDLPNDLPLSFKNRCREYGAKAGKKIDPRRLRDYKRKIALKYVAPAYIAKVSAKVGYGLFAGRDLKPGEMVGEYTGTLSRDWSPEIKKPGDMNPYLLKYPFKCQYAIDARKGGNETRFINHSARHKNIRRVYIFHGGILRVIFAAARNIRAHEQLLLDYGKNYWKAGAGAPLILRS